MKTLLLALCFALSFSSWASAQTHLVQDVLQSQRTLIEESSRNTIGPAIDALVASGLPQMQTVLEVWQAKDMWQRKADGLFFRATKNADGMYTLRSLDTGAEVSTAASTDLSQLKPNSGVRAMIATALVQFQLSDPDPVKRADALDSISRDPGAALLAPLRAYITAETDEGILARKTRLERLMTMAYDSDVASRVAAIDQMSGDLGVDFRATLNPILTTTRVISQTPPEANIAQEVIAGSDALTRELAYALLVAAGDAPVEISKEARDTALQANIEGGRIAASETRVAISQAADLGLDALSLASIYFLAAIGLAITFGVMGVINMAHGEFIMMGAYTGYVVQLFVPNHTASILIAVPLAFAVTFAAGVALERLVVRWLYHRPLETLLATFGVSIALQQLAKNIFGTQARPLTAPAWLDGAWAINDVVSISYIRIAIFILALLFLALFVFIMKRTRLGLETRAVKQNPRMAASMGINPDRVNMLTFGLGSGIAGIAGVAIGLFAKVTSEMGSDYIVQSFMTVVVGGVGNIWGTLAGAAMIGGFQKGIEFLNPSNTLAAQTYMIIFIIIFIQFRPRGIIALKGRAAGD